MTMTMTIAGTGRLALLSRFVVNVGEGADARIEADWRFPAGNRLQGCRASVRLGGRPGHPSSLVQRSPILRMDRALKS